MSDWQPCQDCGEERDYPHWAHWHWCDPCAWVVCKECHEARHEECTSDRLIDTELKLTQREYISQIRALTE